jgi:hypothetical protein
MVFVSKVLAIQHVSSETIGIIANALKSEGVFHPVYPDI